MKYAFMALIAIYLIIYGCSPDNHEKATDSHEKTTPAPVAKPQQHEITPAPVQQQTPAAPIEAEQQHATEARQEPAVVEKHPAETTAEPQQVVMPCGMMMDRADIPENAPCLQPQKAMQDAAVTQHDLDIAMQKMVETTNEMVMATRQLVIATQEMLDAGKMTQPGQPAGSSAESRAPAATTKKVLVETMQDMVSAAKQMVEATSKAVSTAIERKKQ